MIAIPADDMAQQPRHTERRTTTTADPRRYVRVMDLVRAGIEDGSFKPDQMLPSAGTLSVRTGFSRPTIAKALRLLQHEGLIGHIPGLGYYARQRQRRRPGPP
jgi:DNA-binding GntR family transcriptional regulator